MILLFYIFLIGIFGTCLYDWWVGRKGKTP